MMSYERWNKAPVATYLFEMLEAIDDEGFYADAAEDLIVVDHDGLHGWKTLNLWQ